MCTKTPWAIAGSRNPMATEAVRLCKFYWNQDGLMDWCVETLIWYIQHIYIYIYYSWYTHACIYIYTPTYIYISWLCITIRIHRISYHVYMIHYESSWIIYYSCYAIVLDMIQLIDASIQEQATFYWTYIDAMDTIIYGISVDIYPPVIKHGFHDNPPFSSMIFPLSLLITGGHSHYIISPFLLLPC